MKSRASLLPEVDYIDIQVRPESLACAGEPVMLQMPTVPAYALTTHKTQALTIEGIVRGCLEGVALLTYTHPPACRAQRFPPLHSFSLNVKLNSQVFAIGQVYVLISRVTDPQNLQFVGLPPADMLDAVEAAWVAAGFDKDKCWQRACSVSNEWIYTPGSGPVKERLSQRRIATRMIPLAHRTLVETLNPMPTAAAVIARLLAWIDRVDEASRNGDVKPSFETPDGGSIFEDDWWLTELQRRNPPKVQQEDPMAEDGPASDADVAEEDVPAADASSTRNVCVAFTLHHAAMQLRWRWGVNGLHTRSMEF